MSIKVNHKVSGIVSTDGSDKSKDALIALARKCGFGRNQKQIEGIILNGEVYHWWMTSQKAFKRYMQLSDSDKAQFSLITEKNQIATMLSMAVLKPEKVLA